MMRASAATFLSLFALASSVDTQAADPAWSPGGPYAFVQGQTYELSFLQPALFNFLGYELYPRYSPAVYEPLSLTPLDLAVVNGSGAQYLEISASAPYVPAGAPSLNEVAILAAPSTLMPPDAFSPIDGFNIPAGTAFSVKFNIKSDAPLTPGAGDVSAAYKLFYADLNGVEQSYEGTVSLSATIAAVPEPATWAAMLVGLALVAGVTVRRTGMRLPLA